VPKKNDDRQCKDSPMRKKKKGCGESWAFSRGLNEGESRKKEAREKIILKKIRKQEKKGKDTQKRQKSMGPKTEPRGCQGT